ncbi:MAG TPA: hypothetical protein VHV82_14210 [Sporichthyaceae bacterium]|nr:hypothetical protein [Sporichthyaceae bacterium]
MSERSEVSILRHRHPPRRLRFLGGCSTGELVPWAVAAEVWMVHP